MAEEKEAAWAVRTTTLAIMLFNNHLQLRETGRLKIKLLSCAAQAKDSCNSCEARKCAGQRETIEYL